MSKDYQAASQAVYDYYCRTFGRKPDQYKLTPARRKKIIARLKEGYSVSAIQQAIKNLRASQWHMENSHIGLDTFLLKSQERLDDWIARRPKPRHRDPGHYPCSEPGAGPPPDVDAPGYHTPKHQHNGIVEKITAKLAAIPKEELVRQLQQIEAELRQKYPVAGTWQPEVLRETALSLLQERIAQQIRGEDHAT